MLYSNPKRRAGLAMAGVLLILVTFSSVTSALDVPSNLKRYDTKYYDMYTDLGVDATREAALRMTRMAEEYHNRTRDFSGAIRQKFPFLLFSQAEDYYAAGGLAGSAGVFMYSGEDSKLMAIAGEKTTPETWHIIQHEGFHQFAHAVIGGKLPVWANEGLAEYFGESIFTGDGFITGAIPPDRLARLKSEIEDKRLKTIKEMMLMTDAQWVAPLTTENYDQAWSMVYFLVQGDEGKYRKTFVSFMQHVSRGEQWDRAWVATLGPADQFEPRWRAYWTSLPDNPTKLLFDQATAATLTSFLARAVAQKQTFDSFDDFKKAATRNSGFKFAADDWLPTSMLQTAMSAAESQGNWSIELSPAKVPQLIDSLEDGTRIIGSFAVKSGHAVAINTDIDSLPHIMEEARKLGADGKKAQARAMLTDGMKKYPKSVSAAAAKKLLIELK